MDTGDIIDILSGLAALGALAVAIVYGQRNARVADKALRIAEDSASSSRQSAEAAKRSAEAADRVASAEIERDHEALRPDLSEARFAWGSASGQVRPYLYKFRAGRGYALTVYAVYEGGATRPLEIKRILRQGEGVAILASQAGNDAHPARLRLLFWPPELGSAGEQWMCPCGRALIPPEPHWEIHVDVPLRSRGAL